MQKTQNSQKSSDGAGLIWGLASYAMWGFFPVYWKLLASVPALEILAHRMIWSFVFYLLLFMGASFRKLPSLLKQTPRDWALSAVASVLLALNWGIYIYAVNSGHILEGSLAYFINPLLNVAVGVLFFRESFPWMLKLAVLFAALGVAAKIFFSATFPWISLVLAATFCAYGVTKKLSRIPASTSAVLEGAVGLLPALLAVFYFQQVNPVEYPGSLWFLLIMGGAVTGLPLFLFSYAAQRVSYSILGMMQFLAPSLQFAVGVFIYHEAIGPRDLASFGAIWIAVVFYFSYQIYNWRRIRTA